MPTLLQFGAGNIGRSFIAQLFAAAGYDVVFIDVVEELVTQLNARGRYRVMIVDTRNDELWVERVRAMQAHDVEAVVEAMATADIAATAVGPNALSYLYPTLAQGLVRRAERGARPLDIILAENLRNAASIVGAGLRAKLPAGFPLEAHAGLVETSIGKMVPIMTAAQRREDPLWVFAEAYNTLILDGKAFKNPIPKVPGLHPVRNIAAYVDRKLFVHNLGHAAVAYLGYLHDPYLQAIWQAMEIKEVRETARAAMAESARALHLAYPDALAPEALDEHIEDLLRRFRNRALGDTIFRVGRDLLRKLSREDRVIGAMLFDQRHNIPCPATAHVAAAAMEFQGTDERHRLSAPDARFVEEYHPQGLETIFTKVCGLDLDTPADRAIADQIRAAHATLRGAMTQA